MKNFEDFSKQWDQWAEISAIGLAALFLIMLFTHFIISIAKKESKKRFDYLAKYDSAVVKGSFIILALAIFAYGNSIFTDDISRSEGLFYTRIGINLLIFIMLIYVINLVFKYTYPRFLDRRLRKLRYKPRFSPEGNEMKLLSEDEEDVHLDEGMQAEEDVFSIDYDVWVDEKTGYVKIEKYPGIFQVLDCKNCGFHTLKLVKEELIKQPTYDDEGIMKKFYACTYCTRKEEKLATIASKDKYANFDAKKIPDFLLKHAGEAAKKSKIHHIRLKIIHFDRSSEYYEFQRIEEAKKFLNEYKEKD